MAGHVDVRVYAELNEFLQRESRGLTVRRPFQPHQTVKDVLEAMGIPHTEMDLIVVNGKAEDFTYRPSLGDRIAAYPMFEALDIGSTTRLRPVPLRDPRFVVDVNMGGWRGCCDCSGLTWCGRVMPTTGPWLISVSLNGASC